MFTDVVGSTQLKHRIGVDAYVRLLRRHDELFKHALADAPGSEILQDTGDGYFVAFANVTDAVRCALRFQHALGTEPTGGAPPLRIRIGIHLGQLAVIDDTVDRPRVVGIAADIASRLTALAQPGQILLSRVVFDESRQFLRDHPAATDGAKTNGLVLRWVAHGDYLFKGADDPMEVFEVGAVGEAPLSPPADTDKARRSVSREDSETLGWRPAVGLQVPQRPMWLLQRKLGEGTFGEVWLAAHEKLKQQRVFKFCFDSDRLHSFKRELTFFRLIRDALGQRRDIAQLYDVRLDEPPYFLESEFAAGGNLIDWSDAQGGLEKVPLETRLELVAKVCDAVAAAHSVGILHKDIKPGNVLMHLGKDGSPQPQLADFGIGLLADRSQLLARHITESGFTVMSDERHSSRTGTQIYMPPESLAGRPFTTQGDIYALGVLLYQMVTADLKRPLAGGWERDVEDPLLREDISVCVDGDPQRRIKSAADVAQRLRALPQRRRQRADDQRRREHARRRRRLLRITSLGLIACAVLTSIAAVAYVRERKVRLDSQTTSANLALQNGNNLYLLGYGRESRDAFIKARDDFARLGLSTLPADVGLYRSFRGLAAPINTVIGHKDKVMAVAWLSDGKRLCSASLDGTILMWDVYTGREIGRFSGHRGDVFSIAVSRDDRFLLSGGVDQTVRLWDIAAQREIYLRNDPVAEIRGVAFSPDGSLALSATAKPKDKSSGVVRLRDVQTGKELWSSSRNIGEGFYGVAFSSDGDRFLATSYQRHIWIWDISFDQARPIVTPRAAPLDGHSNYVYSAAFSSDGQWVFSGSLDNSARLWNLSTGEAVENIRGRAGIRGVAFAGPVSTTVETGLACSADGSLRLWDLEDATLMAAWSGHLGEVLGLAVSPDRTRAASAGADHTVRIWDLQPDRDVRAVRQPAGITSLAPSPDGVAIAAGDRAGVITLRDVATLRPLRIFTMYHRPIDCVAVLSDGRRLVACDNAGSAIVWDISTSKPLFSRSRRAAATSLPAATNITATVTTTAAAQTTQPDRAGSADWCYSAIDPAGRFGMSTSTDRLHLEIWSLDPSSTATRLIGPTPAPITCIALSPDGSACIVGDDDGVFHLFDVPTGTPVFSEPTDPRHSPLDRVAFSPDGKRALSGGHDKIIRMWDLPSPKPAREFAGHGEFITSLAFARDGRAIYSVAMDRTLRMWDPATGKEVDFGGDILFQSHALAMIPDSESFACALGSILTIWDPSRALRYLELQPQVDAAFTIVRGANPTDPAALLLLGRWYAFRGVPDYAAQCFERARAAGADVPPVELARCYWQTDRRAEALREFRAALQQLQQSPPPPQQRQDYLNLCIQALASPPLHPSPPPATLPVRKNPRFRPPPASR